LQIPSAMVRAMQYRHLFERSEAWRAEFVSRKSERLTRLLNRTDKPRIPLVKPLVHGPLAALNDRWERKHEDEIVQQAKQVDLVYVVKIPHLPLYERLRALNGPKVVMDMNDGLWLPAFQAGDWKPLDRILTMSHAVICENDHVADYARKHNPCVRVVPDAPQVEVFDRWRDQVRRDSAKVVLGWIGSPENVGALYHVLEPLETLFARHPHLHMRIVGADRSILPRFEDVRWSSRSSYDQETMVRETLAFDIGLFPMFHNRDGLARGNLKAMIYMSAGAVAMCENYGENATLIRDGENGVLAATPQEWLEKLERLVTDSAARKAIAQRGLQTIRSKFTAERVFDKLIATFDDILSA
jgi:glycosyltransferase involved in cell wall biosynthesis